MEPPIVLLCVETITGIFLDISFINVFTSSFKKILSNDDSGSSIIKMSYIIASCTFDKKLNSVRSPPETTVPNEFKILYSIFMKYL